MTLSSQIESDLSVFYNTDEFAESGTLNSSSVSVVVVESGEAIEGNAKFDFIDVSFQLSDYSTITYATDTLLIRGATWRYPVMKSIDSLNQVVRFRKNERPLGWK